ncbi:hypothetical protein CSC2_35050 [Clostridium zeae]|uniref:Uncharacterized protein n=1 Tax=Clostridium zeae TaxID=2759022 RepID=A0ABQ1EDZ9_9CLOT|nr:CBO0543 family protein [Clostridium zeae]GFZ32979.1 hypothetical protein CSC2_35050 [Clostridium zeae]
MRLESIILFSVPMISIISLLFVPKTRFFHAQFIFISVQLLTWVLGLTVVELGLIEYPYRELSSANRTSFFFEYLVMPIMCIHFNVHFPEHSTRVIKVLYYLGITLAFSVVEYLVEKYTLILKYTGWQIYWTYISIIMVFWISRVTTRWYFNEVNE